MSISGVRARTFLGRAGKKMDQRMGSVEERFLAVKGDVESMKEDLQRLGSLERSVGALMEKLSILDRLDHEWLRKGDRGSSVKDPNDRDRPVPELSDRGKSAVPETGGPSMEVSDGSGAVTTVGDVVKGSEGQLGGDQTLGERGGLSEEPKRLDLIVVRFGVGRS